MPGEVENCTTIAADLDGTVEDPESFDLTLFSKSSTIDASRSVVTVNIADLDSKNAPKGLREMYLKRDARHTSLC